jgi:hypothetical protein
MSLIRWTCDDDWRAYVRALCDESLNRMVAALDKHSFPLEFVGITELSLGITGSQLNSGGESRLT